MSEGMVRLTYEKWAELEALREENERLRAGGELDALRRETEDLRRNHGVWEHWEYKAARLLNGQEQLREQIRRLEAELADARRELADARRMHGGDNPAS